MEPWVSYVAMVRQHLHSTFYSLFSSGLPSIGNGGRVKAGHAIIHSGTHIAMLWHSVRIAEHRYISENEPNVPTTEQFRNSAECLCCRSWKSFRNYFASTRKSIVRVGTDRLSQSRHFRLFLLRLSFTSGLYVIESQVIHTIAPLPHSTILKICVRFFFYAPFWYSKIRIRGRFELKAVEPSWERATECWSEKNLSPGNIEEIQLKGWLH